MSTLLRLPAVAARTGLSRSTIYERIATGDFPKPVKLGARAIGFVESEVEAHIERTIAASRAKAATPSRGNAKRAAR
jgi:prophage regulatory protein